jgi:hypothetical protein
MRMQSNKSLLPFQRWLSRSIPCMLAPLYSMVLMARYIEGADPSVQNVVRPTWGAFKACAELVDLVGPSRSMLEKMIALIPTTI